MPTSSTAHTPSSFLSLWGCSFWCKSLAPPRAKYIRPLTIPPSVCSLLVDKYINNNTHYLVDWWIMRFKHPWLHSRSYKIYQQSQSVHVALPSAASVLPLGTLSGPCWFCNYSHLDNNLWLPTLISRSEQQIWIVKQKEESHSHLLLQMVTICSDNFSCIQHLLQISRKK